MTVSAVVPGNWKTISLGRLLKSAQSGFASGARDPEGVIQIRMNNVTTDGNLDWTSFIRVPATQKQLDKYHLHAGDVLFNSTNSPDLVGKTTVFDGHAEPVVFSNHFVCLRVDETRLDPWYLARWLTKQWQRRVFENLCTRWVNQASFRKDDLLSLKVPLPPLPEQRRIAAVLAKADRLRRLRRTVRELSDTYLQSVFLEMFGDPVSNPRGWDLVELEDACTEMYRYPTFYGFKYTETGVPVARIGNILPQGFLNPDLSSYVFIDPEISKRFPRTVLELQDILMAVRGDGSTATRIGLVNSPNLAGANMSPNLLRFKANEEILNPLYLFNLMICEGGQRLLGRHVTRTAKRTITARDIKRIKIPSPPLPLQQQFAATVHKFERLRAQQREAERQAEHLFQALLERAFRGAGRYRGRGVN